MLRELWHDNRPAGFALAALALAALSSVIIVPETQQAVVVRLGEPVRVINRFKPKQPFGQTGAGISLRVPFFERVVRIDKRLLTVEMESQMVTSTDQRRLNVDAFARVRIIDPVRMVKSAGTVDNAIEQLRPIFISALRRELGKRTFASLLTAERGEVMKNIRRTLDAEVRAYGAQVIDVRIKRADLPAETLESAFNSMQAAREQEATTIKAQGDRDAQIIRANAQAEAAKIYAAAYGKDPEFYDFYRAMQSYNATFRAKNGGSSTIILSPDNAYLRQFKGK